MFIFKTKQLMSLKKNIFEKKKASFSRQGNGQIVKKI